MRYEGLENIPRGSGYILASNHITAFDPMFIAAKVPGQLHFLAKTELFKNRLIGWVLRHVNAIEIRRGAGDDEPLEEARRRIERGGVFAIFIEGTRSKDGRPQRPRSGVALMSGRTGADILPCAVVYDKRLRFRAEVTVRYGGLIKAESLGIDTASPATMRQAAKTVMADIVSLFEGSPTAGGEAVAG
jgi:1-acyl-sn-glycerol-3-phosphate acyltransferase